MTAYERFKQLPIDHSAIGLEQSEEQLTYYCTPKNAGILGWAGVDGIHYCTIPGFGEMIFAVSPMNFGDCVHPIARNFEDLLRLLLHCGDMAALEQCYAWEEEQFKAFLIDCPITGQQKAVLEVVRGEFGLEAMEDAFSYVKQLQSEFDLSKIPYTEDYYDPDMNAAAPEQEVQWKVSFDGGFWGGDGKPGTEVPIGKAFCWGSENWYIPSAYICDEGLVMDYCIEADPEEVKRFIDKWDLLNESRNHYTREQREQIQREHPLHVRFYGRVSCNRQPLEIGHSCGLTWLPESCIAGAVRQNETAKQLLTHYGLDENRAWAFHRCSYPWGETAEQELHALSVRLERQPEHISGEHFMTPAVGEAISLAHPLTAEQFTLTLRELEPQELPEHLFPDSEAEYPRHFLAMSYTLTPPNPDLMIQDCDDEDHREGCSFGIIGRSHGPSAIFLAPKEQQLQVACSSVHFNPPKSVQWRPVFRVNGMEDLSLTLI